MPNYDLRCSSCGHEANIRASMTEKSKKQIPCPMCNSLEMETVFRTPPALVKGARAAECPNRGRCGSGCGQ